MMYTVKTIANFLGVDYGYIERVIEAHHLNPVPLFGLANLKRGYTFYQLYLIQQSLEQVSRKNISFDIDEEEVFIIYGSKMNYYDR